MPEHRSPNSRSPFWLFVGLGVLAVALWGLFFDQGRRRLLDAPSRPPLEPPAPRPATPAPRPATPVVAAPAPRVLEDPLPLPAAESLRAAPLLAAAEVTPFPWRREEETAPVAEPSTNWGLLARELVETVVLTLVIFVLMRSVVQNYRIEGNSMEPNLHERQYLIVNKASYYLGDPQRGDIIVFEYTKGDPNGPERDYIKRIIGLPGDTVECRPNQILVNGQVIAEPYGPNPWAYTCPPTTLSEDEYFVLGDNRPQSSDSHQWGTLERKDIIGKAWFSYWPWEMIGRVPNYPIRAPDPLSLSSAPTP